MEENNNVATSLQLVISPLQKMEAIKFNYEELKEGLINGLAKYDNIVYTEDTIKQAKEDRAKLNNLAKSLNSGKVNIKNEFMVPYTEFEGKIKESGTFEDYLIKDNKKNISYVTDKKNGKYSSLDYEFVDYKDNYSLVKINLHTGRSHQIRVQFSSRGFPLVGDAKYNKNSDNKTNIALFAKSISFYHPITKEKLIFKLELPKRYPFNLF